jgi:ribosomal protein S18 acetylase RimI-like enzyme
MEKIRLRAATQADESFLLHVLKTTMQTYIEQLWGWDEPVQRQRFEEEFDPGRDQIVAYEGADIGVLGIERHEDALFIDKIYILPDYQRCGIGTALIQTVLDDAFQSDLPVRLRVLKNNPAKRLYERLGFVQVAETETSYVMQAGPKSRHERAENRTYPT